MSYRGYAQKRGKVIHGSALEKGGFVLHDPIGLEDAEELQIFKNSASLGLLPETIAENADAEEDDKEEEKKKEERKKLTIRGMREQLREFAFFHETQVHASHSTRYPVIRKKTILDQKKHAKEQSRKRKAESGGGAQESKYYVGPKRKKKHHTPSETGSVHTNAGGRIRNLVF
jgi:hypothetical protein